MQFHASKQDVLGTLQDVFLKSNPHQENSNLSKIQLKHLSKTNINLVINTSKSKLDQYLCKYQQRKQLQEENYCSISQIIQNANIINAQIKQNDSQTAYSSRLSFPRDSSENDDKEQHYIGAGLSQYMKQLQQSKQITFINQESQTETHQRNVGNLGFNQSVQDSSQSNNSVVDEIKFSSNKHTQKNQISQEIELSLKIVKYQPFKQDFCCQFNTEININQYIENQQINQICQCNQQIEMAPSNNFGSQYDESNNQKNVCFLEQQINNKKRFMTSANIDDQITLLEQQLQLRDEIIESKTNLIVDLQNQLSNIYTIIEKERRTKSENEQRDSIIQNDDEFQKANELDRNQENNINIQNLLIQLKLEQTQEIVELRKDVNEITQYNRKLKEKQEELYQQLGQCKKKLIEFEEEKKREIDLINQDYQNRLAKQLMIIDELKSQISSIQINSIDIPKLSNQIAQNNIADYKMDEVGCDSLSKISTNLNNKNALKNLNKIANTTAGLIANRQDYEIVAVLDRIDQNKTQAKQDSIKKIN